MAKTGYQPATLRLGRQSEVRRSGLVRDIHSSFRSLRNQFAAGLNMGIAGIPWWTTDIGGFHGGNIHDPKFHELLIRWFQWGVFSPVMRLHGNRDPQILPAQPYRDGIAQCPTGAPNEVWSYGEEVCDVLTGCWRCEKTQALYQSADGGNP